MNQTNNAFGQFFGVVARPQTYLNLLYLLLSFPLGLVYFICLVVGISVGRGTLSIAVGFAILLMTFAGWWLAALFERQMAISMLHVDIPPVSRPAAQGETAWDKVKAYIGDPVAWKSLAYLFGKLPLGIVSFTLVVTGISVTLALLLAPLALQWGVEYNMVGSWAVDTTSEALALMLLGVVVGPAFLHASNWLAWASGRFAKVMLGPSPRPAAPQPSVSPAPQPPAPPEPLQAA